MEINLYKVFDNYKENKYIDYCDHCFDTNPIKKLLGKNRKDLSWEDIGLFSFKAMTTLGSIDDYKYYLPRILELCTKEYFENPYQLSLTLRKLEYANWTTWPIYEYESVKAYLANWFNTLIDSGSIEIINDIVEYELEDLDAFFKNFDETIPIKLKN